MNDLRSDIPHAEVHHTIKVRGIMSARVAHISREFAGLQQVGRGSAWNSYPSRGVITSGLVASWRPFVYSNPTVAAQMQMQMQMPE